MRLFIHLWDLQLRDLSKDMYLSTRDLAAHSGLALMSVRAALDQLYSRRAIVLRWGDNARPNRIYVCLWDGEVRELGELKISPPMHSDPLKVSQKLAHLPPENQGCLYASERPLLDSDFDSDHRSIPKDEQKRMMQNQPDRAWFPALPLYNGEMDIRDESNIGINTIIVFVDDNGLAFDAQGLMGKQSMYEHSPPIPLIRMGRAFRARFAAVPGVVARHGPSVNF